MGKGELSKTKKSKRRVEGFVVPCFRQLPFKGDYHEQY